MQKTLPLINSGLFLPVSDENIRGPGLFRISVRGKNQFLPVRGEHGEAIEDIVKGDSLQAFAIDVDQIEFEVVAKLLDILVPIVHVT